jgi:hypothetical protein
MANSEHLAILRQGVEVWNQWRNDFGDVPTTCLLSTAAAFRPSCLGQQCEWKAFDADSGKDSAREIREYFIPDFSNWKDHDSYQQAFQRLLRDLKAEGERTGSDL